MFLKTFSRQAATLALVGCAVGAGTAAHAAELSLLSGIYQSQSSKTSTDSKSTDLGKSQDINVGARYSQPIEGRLYWYAGGLLELKSYSKGDLADAPSDSTSLSLDGGVRYYFNKLSDNVAPFAEGGASYRDAKDAKLDGGGNGFTETESNGLFYNAAIGMRFNLAKEFFFDISTNIFDSPLFATDKSDDTTYAAAGGAKSVQHTETKHTDLYINSTGLLATAKIGLGMRF